MCIATCTIVACTSFLGIQKPESVSHDLLSENIEALTQNESGSIEGRWIVTVYSPTRWTCLPNGGVCCPDVDC